MRIASRFSIAVHILTLCEVDPLGAPTSEWMAGSIGVNAVIVRNITGQLRRAGLVTARQGVAGTSLAKPLEQISLLDVYRAVEVDGELFAIHPRPNPDCPVGANIQSSLEDVFHEAQEAMEARLAATSVREIATTIQEKASI
ncbi:Rrf2 family transcriptional regulator [bacterium SCN 57-13]|nr:Rrf2 family transcriptional regulator [Armatimonadota bacterium]ODU52889.1 MAG: Rrf2 family transcriptional regulator [bacterium SCN 57-13]